LKIERAIRAEEYTREAEEKALESALALQKLQEEMSVQSVSNNSADREGGEMHVVAEMQARIVALEREGDLEREAHQSAAERASELFDNYERARAAVDRLQQVFVQKQ
jgi:hypothetical protein